MLGKSVLCVSEMNKKKKNISYYISVLNDQIFCRALHASMYESLRESVRRILPYVSQRRGKSL